eukprot:2798728-Pleurochrysis_carterae.AAC.3
MVDGEANSEKQGKIVSQVTGALANICQPLTREEARHNCNTEERRRWPWATSKGYLLNGSGSPRPWRGKRMRRCPVICMAQVIADCIAAKHSATEAALYSGNRCRA